MSHRIVVLASGSGTNLQVLIDCMPDDIVAVFCNREKAPALERARRAGIPAVYVPFGPFREQGREAYDADLARQVATFNPQLVVLAGWMHILSGSFLDAFGPRTVLNLHPALMPDNASDDTVPLPDGTRCPVFRGKDALEQALAHGVRWVGSSVHFVTPQVDRGELIARELLEVPPGATHAEVRDRLLALEHRLLPASVRCALDVTAGAPRPSR